MRTGSLRRRVTVATLAIVAASVLGLDVAVAVSLEHRLDAGLRKRLQDRAALAVDLGPGRPERRREELSGDGIEARIMGAAPAPVSSAPARRDARIRATGEQLRITQDVGGMTVILTASRAPIARTMRGLVLIEAFGTLILLAVAGLGVRVVVRAALRPLDAVVATATRIAGGASGERLRPDRPDTELGRLAGAFDTMVAALERSAARAVRAEETMRRFLEDAGHELRTPAANISASAEALLRGDCRRHEREELEVGMIRESQRMGRLVTDIVDLARGRAPDQDCATVDLAVIVRREGAQLRHRHPDLTVDVNAPPAAPVPGDEMGLTRLVGNLLDNAGNASPPSGRVAVRVRWADPDLLYEPLRNVVLCRRRRGRKRHWAPRASERLRAARRPAAELWPPSPPVAFPAAAEVVLEVVLVAPPVAPAAVAVVVAVIEPAVMGEGGGRRRHEQRTAEENRTKNALHHPIPFLIKCSQIDELHRRSPSDGP